MRGYSDFLLRVRNEYINDPVTLCLVEHEKEAIHYCESNSAGHIDIGSICLITFIY